MHATLACQVHKYMVESAAAATAAADFSEPGRCLTQDIRGLYFQEWGPLTCSLRGHQDPRGVEPLVGVSGFTVLGTNQKGLGQWAAEVGSEPGSRLCISNVFFIILFS